MRLALAFTVLLFVILLGAVAVPRSESHQLRAQPGVKLIHKVDHARRAAQGCRQRLEGRTWPVEYLERRTSNLALRAWVLRRWTLRATWKCGELRRAIEARNSARARNIAAASAIFYEGHGGRGDPWPNCPDPFDGSGSWDDTKACESGRGSWDYDPPGYYCGPLQLDPRIWARIIARFGIRCWQ